MEKMKSAIPEALKQKISESTADDLQSTCSSLLHYLQDLQLLHQTVRDLSDSEMKLCGKNKEAALEAKADGNECFSKGDYHNALRFYSKALRVTPADMEDMNKSLIATLYVNRASSLHNLGLFLGSLRDCNRALTINPSYAKAWFRRGKANASLKNYRDAINDLNVSLKMETSMSGRKQIQSELNMILDKSVGKNSELEKPQENTSDELLQTKLQCVSTPAKGRGMASLSDIPQGSLVHKEDPYAAIILKQCRETHCHFCFSELSEDTVPCTSCSIALYCSVECQVRAGGKTFNNKNYEFHENLSGDIKYYIRHVTSLGNFNLESEQAYEHSHECGGVHWPVVLPSDVVLAGRVLVKYIKQQRYSGLDPNFHQTMDLSQRYEKLSGESKLEFHVYSIILLCCLRQTFASKLPLNSTVTSRIVILLSQIRVNSMGIANIRFSDAKQPLYHDVTSSVEQVRVALAVYCRGSMFNHSCQPNIHAYFHSRTLFIRATENVAAGSELELSYGPQVGQWGCHKRREFLEDRYSFTCQCSGCLQLNLSDLVIHAYQCTEPNCVGVVLDSCVAKYENEKLKHFKGQNSLQGGMSNALDCIEVASHVLDQTGPGKCFEPEHCSSCGTYCDLQASQKAITKSEFYVKRLKDAIVSSEIPTDLVMDALKSTFTLKKILHRFNKRIAEVEDNIAQAFCLVGDLQAALGHSQASVGILGKLYGENHIVIGHELIKLATIQQSMGHKSAAAESMHRLVAIFSRYYGLHADTVLPSLPFPDRE